MTRARVRYVCQECGQILPKWQGRCPACEAWNTVVEEPLPVAGRGSREWEGRADRRLSPIPVTEVAAEQKARLLTGLKEVDRVLGGGLVPASLILIGGDPGIGKSTLLLQIAGALAERGQMVLYVSGEESAGQVRLRAERLGVLSPSLLVCAETDLSAVEEFVAESRPALVVVDSIQTVYLPELASSPGSVGQVRECGAALLRLAKTSGVPIAMVGHVTKAGALAGPRVLEHLVDTVLYFEGEGHHAYRVLRAVKNRFGSTNEIGVFEMGEDGLREVQNPSEVLLAQRPVGAAGSVVTAALEGTRPLLVEVQALVGGTSFTGLPRRQATGLDHHRVHLILAVLEERAELALANRDLYVSVAGGVRVEEPAADLGIALAITSSLRRWPVNPRLIAVGELGLAGEVRAVHRMGLRLWEASRLGFEEAIVPRRSLDNLQLPPHLKVRGAETIQEAIKLAWGGEA